MNCTSSTFFSDFDNTKLSEMDQHDFTAAASTLVMFHTSRLIAMEAIIRIRRLRRRKAKNRRKSRFTARMDWNGFCEQYGGNVHFARALRMDLASFNKLLGIVELDLTVNPTRASARGGEIKPAICLYITIRWLAGGSYLDIYAHSGVSVTHFYYTVWRTIRAINKRLRIENFPVSEDDCSKVAAGFQSISTDGAISNCIGCIDGYLMRIVIPSKVEAGNVKSYFSGHYQCYGVNVQGICDHLCRFSHLCVTGPGVMNDRDAIHEKIGDYSVVDMMNTLPAGYVLIGDAAYPPSEKCASIFYGNYARDVDNDNWNFYASQCRIRIEMAFGLMLNKWGILKQPLRIPLCKLKHLLGAIGRLHNFCINERPENVNDEADVDENRTPYRVTTPQDPDGTPLGSDTDGQMQPLNISGNSVVRARMVQRIKTMGLKRPKRNMIDGRQMD